MYTFKYIPLTLVLILKIILVTSAESDPSFKSQLSEQTNDPPPTTYRPNKFTAYPNPNFSGFRRKVNKTQPLTRRRRIRVKATAKLPALQISTTEGHFLPASEQENLIEHLKYEGDTLKIVHEEPIDGHPLFQNPTQERFNSSSISTNDDIDGDDVIWRVNSVKTHDNFDILYPNNYGYGEHFLNAINPQFHSSTNTTDLLISESSNPYANTTSPFSSDLGLSANRLHALHPLLNSDAVLTNVESKIPEDKKIQINHELSDSFGGTPFEPDIYQTFRKKHPLLNEDSIISTNREQLPSDRFPDIRPHRRRKIQKHNSTHSKLSTISDTDKYFGRHQPMSPTHTPELSIIEILPTTSSPLRVSANPRGSSTEVSMTFKENADTATIYGLNFEGTISTTARTTKPTTPKARLTTSTTPVPITTTSKKPRTTTTHAPTTFTTTSTTTLRTTTLRTTQKPKRVPITVMSEPIVPRRSTVKPVIISPNESEKSEMTERTKTTQTVVSQKFQTPPQRKQTSSTTLSPIFEPSTTGKTEISSVRPRTRKPHPLTTTTTTSTTTIPSTEQPVTVDNSLVDLFNLFQQPQQPQTPQQNDQIFGHDQMPNPNIQANLESIIQQAFLSSLFNSNPSSTENPLNLILRNMMTGFPQVSQSDPTTTPLPPAVTHTQPPQTSIPETQAVILPSPIPENPMDLLTQLLQLGSAVSETQKRQNQANDGAQTQQAAAQTPLDLQTLLASNWLNGLAGTTTTPSPKPPTFDLSSLFGTNWGNNFQQLTTRAPPPPEFTQAETQQQFNFFQNLQPKPEPQRKNGLYYWFDINAFLGQDQSTNPMAGIRPKLGQRDYFLRV